MPAVKAAAHSQKSFSIHVALGLELFTLAKLAHTTAETCSGENVVQQEKDFKILVPPPCYSRPD